MSLPTASTALIIGASRGLGYALAEEYLKRGWHVIGTVRGNGRTALHDLADRLSARLEIEKLDITVEGQLAALRQKLQGRRIDLLFVNAGVTNNTKETSDEVSTEEFMRVMLTNALSPMRAIAKLEALVPPSGSIAVMSSILGSVAENNTGGWEVYRASKSALNSFMRSLAARMADDPRALMVIAPGWVRTDMGGERADLSIDESIPRVVDVVSRQNGKPGLAYLDYRGETVRW